MEQDFNRKLDGSFAKDLKQAGLHNKPLPREWLQLAAQLDAYDRQKYLKQRGWLRLVLGLLLVSNLWTWFQLSTIQSAMMESAAKTISVQPNYTRERIVILDTVYQTLVIRNSKFVSDISPSNSDQFQNRASGQTQQMGNAWRDAPLQSSNTEDLYRSKKEVVSAALWPDEEQKYLVGQTAMQNQDSIYLTKITAVSGKSESDFVASDSVLDQIVEVIEQKSQKPQIKPVRKPLRYRIGVGSGMLHVLNSKEDKAPAAFMAQCSGEILIGKHWSVSPSISFMLQDLELDHPADPRWMLQLPPSLNPEYTFQHLEGRLRYWIPAFQLRYYFRPEKKWSWYAGSGYAARIFHNGDLDTEYFDPSTNLEIKVESNQNIPVRKWNISGQLGTACRIKQSHWQIFADCNGIFDVGNGQQTFPLGFAQLGIKWGTR